MQGLAHARWAIEHSVIPPASRGTSIKHRCIPHQFIILQWLLTEARRTEEDVVDIEHSAHLIGLFSPAFVPLFSARPALPLADMLPLDCKMRTVVTQSPRSRFC